MGTPHNQAEKGEIAKKVLMPGDQILHKYIKEIYITDANKDNKDRGPNT